MIAMAQDLGFLPGPVKRILLALVIVYILVCVLAWVFQRGLIYFPDTTDPDISGDRSGLQDVTLTASDGTKLRAWYWPVEDARGSVVLFHGNAGNRADRRFWMARARELGWNVLVPDYRGYGGSEGSPTESGLYLDGQASWEWLVANAPAPHVISGSSIGTGVAVEIAKRVQPAGLLLTAAPTSMPQVGQDAYPFLPVKLLMRDRFDNAAKIADVTCPVLMLHGEDDKIIAIDHGRALFAKANEPKTFVALPDVGHNDVWGASGDAYWKAVKAFLATVAR